MNPTLPTTRDTKKQQLLKACSDAEAKYNALPCKETSEAMDEALDAYNAFQNQGHPGQGKDTDYEDRILKILAATLATSMLVWIVAGLFQ